MLWKERERRKRKKIIQKERRWDCRQRKMGRKKEKKKRRMWKTCGGLGGWRKIPSSLLIKIQHHSLSAVHKYELSYLFSHLLISLFFFFFFICFPWRKLFPLINSAISEVTKSCWSQQVWLQYLTLTHSHNYRNGHHSLETY